MTPLEFIYWLKGYFDITRTSKLEPQNVDVIKKQMEEVLVPKLINNNITFNDSLPFNVPPSDFGKL